MMQFIHKVTGEVLSEDVFRSMVHRVGFISYFPKVITEESISETMYNIYQENEQQTVQTPQEILLGKIQELEQQITSRRLREAILGIDNAWLLNTELSINTLRIQLRNLEE